ncbi:hypothetical protein [Vibrio coralliirubri]|uniref:hypothetical protein n=1 Tax=Vibrio coralliirubri TaxID=1516159 RepID=UPI0006303EBE|nr:hypothetical protein [Vibrio coralliirubri]CDT91086.1 hypothetical protein VCR8J2_40133 [Vibrio coralliirubri]
MDDFLLTRIRRKIIKKYIKLTHKKSDWFKADYWPDVTFKEEQWHFKQNKLDILTLSSLELAESRVNIIGSGPSVNELDFAKLKEANNIFLNGAISLAHKEDLPIFAHVIMDSNFVYNRFDLLKNSAKNKSKLILSLGALCAIAERDFEIIRNNEIYLFHIKPISDTDSFTHNIDQYVIDGGTVMAVAIQSVLNANPSSAYLLGLDISNAHLPRFYEQEKHVQKSGLQKDFEDKILPFMTEAKKQYDAKEVGLYNCSPVSKLPFDIIPYSDHYEKK